MPLTQFVIFLNVSGGRYFSSSSMEAELKGIRLRVPGKIHAKGPEKVYSLRKIFSSKTPQVKVPFRSHQSTPADGYSMFPTRSHKYKVNRSMDSRVHVQAPGGMWSYISKPVLHVPRVKTTDDIRGDLLVGARHAVRQLQRDKFDVRRVDRAWNRFAKLRDLPDFSHGWYLDHDGKRDDYTNFPLTIISKKYKAEGKVKKPKLVKLNEQLSIERLSNLPGKLLMRPDHFPAEPPRALISFYTPRTPSYDPFESHKEIETLINTFHRPYKVHKMKIRSKELFPTFPLNKHWWIKGNLEIRYYRVFGAKKWTWLEYFWSGPPLSKYYVEMVARARKVRTSRLSKVLSSTSSIKKAKKRKYMARCLRLCFGIMQLFTKRGHDLRHWLLLKIGERKYQILRRACRIFRRRQIRYNQKRANICKHARLARKGRKRRIRRLTRGKSGGNRMLKKVFRKPRCGRRVDVSIGRRMYRCDEKVGRKLVDSKLQRRFFGRKNKCLKLRKFRPKPVPKKKKFRVRNKRKLLFSKPRHSFKRARKLRSSKIHTGLPLLKRRFFRQIRLKPRRPGPVQR